MLPESGTQPLPANQPNHAIMQLSPYLTRNPCSTNNFAETSIEKCWNSIELCPCLVTILHMFLLTVPHCRTIVMSFTVRQEVEAAPSQTVCGVIEVVVVHSLCMDMVQLVSLRDMNVLQDVAMVVVQT